MLRKDVFIVKGLDCQDEIILLKKALSSKKGILKLSFDIVSSKMIVDYERSDISPSHIIREVKRIGLRAALWSNKESFEKLSFWDRYGKLIMVILSGFFLVLGFIYSHYFLHEFVQKFFEKKLGGYEPFLVFTMYALSLIFGLWFVVPKAFHSVKRVRGDMNLLMIIAVLGAIFIGQWFEAATVAFLFSLALVLEHGCIQKSRKAISKLMDLGSKVAMLIKDDGHILVDVGILKVKDRILIKPGEKIPIDAVIVKGSSKINQAPMTGESLPVEKTLGDEIFAGTINMQSVLECEVSKVHTETMLAKMIDLVEKAHAKKAHSEKWIESFALVYTPIVILIALGVMLIPPLLYNFYWIDWIYRGLVILVIACPCALVISTPVSIVAALTSSARNGVLIKGGKYLEAPSKLKAIAFDKTGTLTEGELTVQEVIKISDLSENEIITLSASLEIMSSHPLARSIINYAEQNQIKYHRAEQSVEFQGKGIEGLINNKRYFIGSHKFLHEKQLETLKTHKKAIELEEKGYVVIILGSEDEVLGIIALTDKPRTNITRILQNLKDQGIEQLTLLTGDSTKSAELVAKATGVDSFYSELLPEDKVEVIEELRKKYGYVAMVGDGINDAPALASATVGIAMAAIGSDIAIEAADIALMTDDMGKLSWLLRHSKRALCIIKQNVIFSLIIKLLFMTLALLGKASLWMAIASDTGASLLVIFNGLRLLSFKEK